MPPSEIGRMTGFFQVVKVRSFLRRSFQYPPESPVISAPAPHDRYGLAQFPSLAIWRELAPPTRPSCARASGDPGAAKNRRIERPRTGVFSFPGTPINSSGSASPSKAPVAPQHGVYIYSGPDHSRAALPHARASCVANPPPSPRPPPKPRPGRVLTLAYCWL